MRQKSLTVPGIGAEMEISECVEKENNYTNVKLGTLGGDVFILF